MFGKEEQSNTIMHQLVFEIVNTTLQMCAQLNATNMLSEKSDVIEAFFSLLAQIYKKVPQLLQSTNLDMAAVFQCAVVCLAMPEAQTMKVCTSFLVHFISQSRDTAQANVVQTYGESLILRVLLILGEIQCQLWIEVIHSCIND